MREKNKLAIQKSEAQKEKHVSQTRPKKFNQSQHSPLDRILQRTVGNQAVQRLVRSGALQANTMNSQTKPTICLEDIYQIAHKGLAGTASLLPYLDKIQQSFGPGHDLTSVKSYIGGQAAEATQRLGATAYTSGERIAFNAPPSLQTAAHEAAHVVQQRAGVQLQGGLGQTGDKYEQHADQVANEVVAGRSVEGFLNEFVGSDHHPASVQKQAVQFWGPEHADFTRRAVDRWNSNYPNGTYMHISEPLKARMVECSDDPDHTARALYILSPLPWFMKSDYRIYLDFLLKTKEMRYEEYAKATPAEKKKLEVAAYISTCASEGASPRRGQSSQLRQRWECSKSRIHDVADQVG